MSVIRGEDQWRAFADQLRPRFQKLGDLMDRTENDVLAYMAFPKVHWQQIHSTNPIERLNAEVKRRTDAVGIFPNDRAIVRLVGAILNEQSDEWALKRRYLQLEGLQSLSDTPTARLSAIEAGAPCTSADSLAVDLHNAVGRDWLAAQRHTRRELMESTWKYPEDIRYLAERIQLAKKPGEPLGRTILFVGAGCSVSAGIPGASQIAKEMCIRVASALRLGTETTTAVEAYNALVANSNLGKRTNNDGNAHSEPDWHLVYDEMFNRHFTTPDDVRDLFSDYVERAAGAINWAHLCLGELVSRRLVSTVLTTNFDQLALAGMARAGVLPVLCDGIESLNRISGTPRHPQLVELHGSRHTYLLRNSPEEVSAIRESANASSAVSRLFGSATTFVAVGYGGREDGIMDLLQKAGETYSDKNLFWVAHGKSPDQLSPKVARFLATSRNSRVILGQDADTFFLTLCGALRIGTPTALARPLASLSTLIDSVGRSDVVHSDIKAEILAAQSLFRRLETAQSALAHEYSIEQRLRDLRLKDELEAAYELATDFLRESSLDRAEYALVEEVASVWLAWGKQKEDQDVLRRALYEFGRLLDETRIDGSKNRVLHKRIECSIALTEFDPGSDSILSSISMVEDALKTTDFGEDVQSRHDLENDLGHLLWILGERTLGNEHLERSVRIFADALLLQDRQIAPLEWAHSQHRLGTALLSLGERRIDDVAIKKSVSAFEAALEERTPTSGRSTWISSLNNYAMALLVLAGREGGEVALERAREAYDRLLEECTRGNVPSQDLNMISNNKALALIELGVRRKDPEALGEAERTLRELQRSYSPTNRPLDWVRVTTNLAHACIEMCAMKENVVDPDLAFSVQLLKEASNCVRQDEHPGELSRILYLLGRAHILRSMGSSNPNGEESRLALEALEASSKLRQRSVVPLLWADVQEMMGRAEALIARSEKNVESMQRATCAFRASLEVRTRLYQPIDFATSAVLLADALLWIDEHNANNCNMKEVHQLLLDAGGELTTDSDKELKAIIDGISARSRSLQNHLDALSDEGV